MIDYFKKIFKKKKLESSIDYKIGHKYYFTNELDNPFNEDIVIAKIVDIKKGWVKYATYVPSLKSSLFQNNTMKVERFSAIYKDEWRGE